tara:strand:+ start:1487 stop:3418 length:1932 start_codon:yes stop_codon:yes gene_type:complete
MKNIKSITLFLVFSIYAFTSSYSQSTIHINEGDRIQIGKNISYFVDTTRNLGINDIQDKTFIPCDSDILNLGNIPDNVWMRFTVNSETEKEIFLEISASLLNELEVYEIVGASSKHLFSGSSNKNFCERPIMSENWLLDLKLQDATQTTFYIKGHSIYPFQIPIVLSSKKKLVEHNQLRYLFWGLYLGIMVFAFLYNLFVYMSVRDRSYLYYLFYIISSMIFYLGLEGFAYQFIWPNSPGINPMIPVFVSITNISITFFTLHLLGIDKKQKGLLYTAYAIIIINVLLIILNLTGLFVLALVLSQMFSLLGAIYFIIAGIISLKRGVRVAKYFLIGWTAFLIMVIVFILALNNVVPSNFITTHGIFIGHMTEVLLLSFALADRINLLQLENQNKQEEIILQLGENRQLQTKVNRELGQKVAERTAELVKQKDRSDKLLLNILPAEIAEELKEKGSAEAQLIKFATVLFTDFQGFTAISEDLTPQELVHEVNLCFSEFDHIMERHNIEKIKTIGDAYMAAGGLPTVNETHAIDAVEAALEIQAFMNNLAEEKKKLNEPYFEARIGIHTGPVVAGIVGVKKYQYDIWGDTVNTANRMESSGAPGMINISATTYEILKDHEEYEFESRGKIEAKGKGLMEMYFVYKK